MLTLELHLGGSPLPTFTVDLACIGKPARGRKDRPGETKEKQGEKRTSLKRVKHDMTNKQCPQGEGDNTSPRSFDLSPEGARFSVMSPTLFSDSDTKTIQ